MRALLLGICFIGSCFSYAEAGTTAVPFENHSILTLSKADRGNILELARSLSDQPVKVVTIEPMLPTPIPLTTVMYADEIIGTYMKDTRLRVYKKDPRYHNSQFLNTLDLIRGEWGTRRDFFEQKILRIFDIDGSRLPLMQADELNYREIERVLRAVKTGAILCEAKDCSYVDRIPPDKLFSRITSLNPDKRPGFYRIDIGLGGWGFALVAQLDGTRLIISAVELSMT